ncbi:MAG: hypothetical protein AAGF11_29230 [Myxococcota bacterium]
MSDSAPSPRSADGSRATGEPAASPWAMTPGAFVVGPLCLVLLAGLTMPPHQGVLGPVVLVLGMAVIGTRRLGMMPRAFAALAWGAGGAWSRWLLLGVVMVATAVLLTVLARGIGVLLVEIPASLFGAGAALGVALLGAALGSRLPERARPVLWLGLALAIPAAGVLGTRYEQAGPDARGSAHGGAILGIHPFQTTAILVDGHGPFDLPINDYVEPNGDRGYGPQALADALDRALVSIAERVYPEGPHRIRRALIDADVEAVWTPAVWERLDREPTEATQPRLRIHSGSFGRGSRVEFVCPGRRIAPRDPPGDSVMNRMCPDKYASEASAGLGVTGRWSGYSEQRGNDRLGLFRLWGWTRSDDGPGRQVQERETRLWAWLVLVLVAGSWLGRPGATRDGRPASAIVSVARALGDGLRGVGGVLGVLAVVAVVVIGLGGAGGAGGVGELAVGLGPSGPSWSTWPSLTVWAPALALGALVLFGFEGPPPSALRAITVPAVFVVVGTVSLAAALPALLWALPMHPVYGARLPALVRGVAEALGEPLGLTIFEVEGSVASVVVVVLLGGAIATGAAAKAAIDRLAPRPRPWGVGALLGVLVLAAAAALVISRKTAGAVALVPGVIGLTLVLGSSMQQIADAGARSWPGRLVHLGWVALGVALVVASVEPLVTNTFVIAYAVVGLGGVVLVGGIGLLVSRRISDDPDPLERQGTGRL